MTKPKETAAQRITRELTEAREQLVAMRADLEPKITAELDRVAKLRDAYDKAGEEQQKLYGVAQKAEAAVAKRLAAVGTVSLLRQQILANLGEAVDLSAIDVEQFVREQFVRLVRAEPEVAAAFAKHADASARHEKANREWNLASNRGFAHAWQREIDDQEKLVLKLSDELRTLPDRRKAERAKRAEERAQERSWAETAKARELLKGFVFVPTTSEVTP